MKSKSIRIASALTVLLALLLLIMSCGPGPQNTANQSQSQNQGGDNTQFALAADGACDEGNIDEKIKKIRSRIFDKMSSNLQQQNTGNANAGLQPRFNYEVVKSPDGNYIEVYFEAGVSGVDGLKDLADALNDFKKKSCVLKVYFLPDGSLPLTPESRLRAFDWTACEWPTVPCPNGECAKSCPSLSPSPGILNSNTNSNSNRNTTSNSANR